MEGTLQNISLASIGDCVGTPPSSGIRGSVRRIGVIQPVLLAEKYDTSGEIRLIVVDGNRRIAAARVAGLTNIPAIVFSDLQHNEIAELTLIANSFRASNYLTEFWAIKQLERNHYSEARIRTISGILASKINHRSQLSELNRELFLALRNGKLYQTYAIAAAKLPQSDQSILQQRYRVNGRLLKKDIEELSPASARKQRARVHSTESGGPQSWASSLVNFKPASTPGKPDLHDSSPDGGPFSRSMSSDSPSEESAFQSHATATSESNTVLADSKPGEPTIDISVINQVVLTQVANIMPGDFDSPRIQNVQPLQPGRSNNDVRIAASTPHQASELQSLAVQMLNNQPLSLMSILTDQLLQAISTAKQLGMDREEIITFTGQLWDSPGGTEYRLDVH